MINQRTFYLSIVVILLFLFVAEKSFAQTEEEYIDNTLANVEFQHGPDTADLDNIAEISIPEGYQFAGKDDTQTIMEYIENLVSGLEVGLIAPEGFGWMVVFEFDPMGYVKDDEKNELDADAILEVAIEATEKANEERRKRGWGILSIVGWVKEPFYNEETHNLEWAIKNVDEDGYYSLNYNTRILGRKGVMSVTLVCPPESLRVILNNYEALLSSFTYNSGQKYAEYVEGDDVAKIGLTALIVGGGAAVAAKSGLFKWLWKIIVLVIVALAGFFKKIFRRDKSI